MLVCKGGRFLIYFITLLLFLIPHSVSASNWELYSEESDFDLYIDKDSIRVNDSNVKAWVKWEYKIPQEIESEPPKKYRILKSLNLFNCQGRTMANLKSVYYSDSKEKEVVYSSENWDKSGMSQLSEVVPDSVGEMVLDYVCREPKKQRSE